MPVLTLSPSILKMAEEKGIPFEGNDPTRSAAQQAFDESFNDDRAEKITFGPVLGHALGDNVQDGIVKYFVDKYGERAIVVGTPRGNASLSIMGGDVVLHPPMEDWKAAKCPSVKLSADEVETALNQYL